MKIKELRTILSHWEEYQYNNYEVVLWDASRQKRMNMTFTGASHPDQEISFLVTDADDPRIYEKVECSGIPQEVPSPFVEGKVAKLTVQKDYELMGVKFPRYFYLDPTGKQFTTEITDTYTMEGYYREKMRQYREILKEKGIPWE